MNTSFRGLGRDALVYGLVGAAGQSIEILLLPVYSRVFPPEQYGVIEIIAATVMVTSLLLGLQIDSGMARHYHEVEDEEERGRLLASGMAVLALVALAGTAAAVAGAPWLAQALTGQDRHAVPLMLGLAVIPFQLVFTYWLFVFRLERSRRLYAVFQLAWTVLALALSVLFVVGLDWGLAGVFGAKLAAVVVVTGGLIPWIVPRMELEPSRSAVREILRYGVPLTPSSLSGWAQRYVDRYFIVGGIGLPQLGVYAVAMQVSSAVRLLNKSFRLAWVPFMMAVVGTEEDRDKYRRALNYYLTVAVAAGGLVALWSSELVGILAPETYRGAASLVGILVAGWIGRGAFSVTGAGVAASKRTIFTTVAFGLGLAVNVVGLVLLIPRFELFGAALAFLAGFTVAAGMAFVFSRRLYDQRVDTGRVGGLTLAYASVYLLSLGIGAAELSAGGAVAARLGLTVVLLAAVPIIGLSGSERRRLRAELRAFLADRAGGSSR